MSNENDLNKFKEYISKNYKHLKDKIKNYCYNKKLLYSEDVFQETLLKCMEQIKIKGLADISDKGCENYIFMSMRNNIYNNYLSTQKDLQRKVEITDKVFDLEDEEYIEDTYAENKAKQIQHYVRENYSTIEFKLWFYKHFVTINGKALRYKDISKITGIKSVKKIICTINNDIKEKFENDNFNFYNTSINYFLFN